jgi:hypothetical protein
MSNLYAIKEETLSALGDTVRSKTLGSKEFYISGSQEFNNSPDPLAYISFSTVVKKMKIKGFTSHTNETINTPYYLSIAPAIYTHVSNAIQDPNRVVIDYYGDFEIIINSNVATLSVQSYIYASDKLTLSYEVWGLDENGNEFKYTPLEMAQKLDELNTNPIQLFYKTASRVSHEKYGIAKEDLGDITRIGSHAFYGCSNLEAIELSDTITKISENAFNQTAITDITLPASVVELTNSSFNSCSSLTTIRILNDTSVLVGGSNTTHKPISYCNKLTSIYIPSKLYKAYCNDSIWSQYSNYFVPVGEWVFDPNIYTALEFNQSKELSIELLEFASTPQISITSSNEDVLTISNININEDNTLLTFTINSLAVEGDATIELNIIGENTYSYSGTVKVYETFPEPSYEIIPQVEGASYGFALREDGYWESQNFKKGVSAAVCQINISNPLGKPVYIDCINFGENNYDYGVLGNIGQELAKTNTTDSSNKKSFRGLASANIQTVEYLDAVGECFIQVKYLKDSSGDQNNDSLRFKVRFGE